MSNSIHGQLIAGNRLSLSLFQEKGMQLSYCEESTIGLFAWAQHLLYTPIEIDNGLVRQTVLVHIEDTVDKLSKHGLDADWVRSQIIGHHFSDVILQAKAQDLVKLCSARLFKGLDPVEVDKALRVLESSYADIDQQFIGFKIVRHGTVIYLEVEGQQVDLRTLKIRSSSQPSLTSLSGSTLRSSIDTLSVASSDSFLDKFSIPSTKDDGGERSIFDIKKATGHLSQVFAPFVAIKPERFEEALEWALSTSVSHHSGEHSKKFKGNPSVSVEVDDSRIVLIVKGYRYEVDSDSLVVNRTSLELAGLEEEEILKIQEYVHTVRFGTAGRVAPPFSLVGRNITILSSGELVLHKDGSLIGSGNFKHVEKVVELITGKRRAFYFATINGLSIKEAILAKDAEAEEIAFMEHFKQDRQIGVITLSGRTQETPIESRKVSKVGVSMPYYNLGSLDQFLTTKVISQKQEISLALQLAQALQGLHQRGLVHRDIKLGNIFVKNSKAKDLKVVLGDVAFLTSLDNEAKKKEIMGSPLYMAPEYVGSFGKSLAKMDYKACDVWALGITFYQMLYGGNLPKQIESMVAENVKDGGDFDGFYRKLSRFSFPVTFPSDHPLNDMLSHMLDTVHSRWTIDQVVEGLAKIPVS